VLRAETVFHKHEGNAWIDQAYRLVALAIASHAPPNGVAQLAANTLLGKHRYP
jgi:hypothetical protein